MCKFPISALSRKILNLLNRCYDSPRFFIEMMEYTENYDNTTIYQCKYGIEINNDIDIRYVKFRYSEILKLYNHIRGTFGNTYTFHDFPPKRLFFINTSSNIINERIRGFKVFLEELNTICGISKNTHFRKFFNGEKS